MFDHRTKNSFNGKVIVRRYYEELWNRWDLAVLDEIVAADINFRGSLSLAVKGIDGFKRYVNMVRAAFPDFHNSIEDLIAEGDKVAARLTYRGTHQGELFGLAATGKVVTYAGIAIFRIANDRIFDGWVLGDLLSLLQQLEMIPPIAGEYQLQKPRQRRKSHTFPRLSGGYNR